jgi:hypothetical protein
VKDEHPLPYPIALIRCAKEKKPGGFFAFALFSSPQEKGIYNSYSLARKLERI